MRSENLINMKTLITAILLTLSAAIIPVSELHAQVRDISTEEYLTEIYPSMCRPIVIDFGATWCGPCRNYSPIFHDVARKYYGKADFYRVDIDENMDWCRAWNISSVPTTVIVINRAEELFVRSGILSAKDLSKLIDKAIRSYNNDDGDYF